LALRYSSLPAALFKGANPDFQRLAPESQPPAEFQEWDGLGLADLAALAGELVELAATEAEKVSSLFE
jgi:hypothetical protein